MRDSFIFYRSFYEAISDLDDMQQLEIYKAIADFSLNFAEPNLSGVSATIFKLIKPQLEANNKRYENGSKPKNKRNGSETEAKTKQEESKTEANKNENKNKNNKEFSYSEDFEIIYNYYKTNTDRPVGDKKKAYESFKKRLKEIEYKELKIAVYNYLVECKKTKTFTKHLVSFLNSDINIYIREIGKDTTSVATKENILI